MARHTINELRQWQALPLSIKIRMTEERIRMWVREYGERGVYVSFSGGKDSTVLLDIVRNRMGYTDIPAVFVDTGLEYPEIREFVKTFDNVAWLKPEMQFRNVIDKYGYPFISKEVSGCIEETNQFLDKIRNQGVEIPQDVFGFLDELYEKKVNFGYTNLLPVRSLQMIGKVPHKAHGVYTGEFSNMYNKRLWGFLLNFPYGRLSNKCCAVMKKHPIKEYAKHEGRNPITGQMASESILRQAQWLKKGCNSFDSKNPISNPLSFWTDQDILQYVKENNIRIASVYGEVVYDENKSEQLEGQLEFVQDGIEEAKCVLKTTGCSRTGCMFCGYGCHLEKEGEGRFEKMKKTHPKQYEWIMRDWNKGGLGYKKVIDWINENGHLNIRY